MLQKSFSHEGGGGGGRKGSASFTPAPGGEKSRGTSSLTLEGKKSREREARGKRRGKKEGNSPVFGQERLWVDKK